MFFSVLKRRILARVVKTPGQENVRRWVKGNHPDKKSGRKKVLDSEPLDTSRILDNVYYYY